MHVVVSETGFDASPGEDGARFGKSFKMHHAKTLAALGVSPVEAGLRTAFVFRRWSACYLSV